MEVDGEAFKTARQQIRKEFLKGITAKDRKLRGVASVGTQEWLADLSMVYRADGKGMKPLNVRTIQYLEKGEATITTIDAVSPHLSQYLNNGFNGYEHIIGYGDNLVSLSAPNIIDFRPTAYPLENKTFYETPFVFSIDPLIIKVIADEDIDQVKLVGMTAKLFLDDLELDFKWLYKVALNPTGQGWLGVVEEVFSTELNAPVTERNSIMFAQRGETNMSWSEFVQAVEKTTTGHVQINLTIEFENFVKRLPIAISTAEMGTFFEKGRLTRQSDWPFFVQPKTIVLLGDK